MHPNNRLLSSLFKKTASHKRSFGSEIAAAVLVKFLLLWGLWWMFFAGNKQVVDGEIIANKIFGAYSPVITSKKNKGYHLK